MKKCGACGGIKPVDNFSRSEYTGDGFCFCCNECEEGYIKANKERIAERKRTRSRTYYKANKKIIVENQKRYLKQNPEQRKKQYQYQKQYYKNNPQKKEALRVKEKDYRKKNKEKINARQKVYYQNNKTKVKECKKTYQKNNPEKKRAKYIINRLIDTGKLVRPTICSECGDPCKPDGHHEDYNKPLDVVWLCRSCHMTLHANERRATTQQSPSLTSAQSHSRLNP